ncbi:very long chain fatty acid elongase 4-like [Amphiura filiformis]|uniref:very long chain fatty acid elongase 4-like n=1 Tax=Amphiura filiformis TaxID=82378 RepID=UPI003B217F95
MAAAVQKITEFYDWMIEVADPRVEDWLLMRTPFPALGFIAAYFVFLWIGPKLMANRKPFDFKPVLVVYNFFLVALSVYMFYEFRVTSWLANYSYKCQPVDYSNDPLARRMASVCWWYFFSQIIELLNTFFFVLRKKNNQVSFLHVYHHSTMIVNWWLGVKYIAGGQAFFLAMFNCFVHIVMYTYYCLSAIGPHMQKYLWWKKYMTQLQLLQFFAVVFHTGYNMTTDCPFPQGFNYAVFLYAISMIILFGNFYAKSYRKKEGKHKV